ncbi:MAG: D-alanine--D-alanine ligase [Lachnospiraceae bacterium]|nr:D-alanine--D-alanine ligase [Lachnospiraceae bacterium]
MDIVVLAGGLSTERDVSFSSGQKITEALRSKGHRAILLDVFMGYGDEECDVSDAFANEEAYSVKTSGIPDTAPDLAKVKESRKDKSDSFFGPNVLAICKKAEVVFLALHGADGENGKLQAAFDLLGIKYTGNGSLPCALAMDKGIAKQFMMQYDIPTPHGFTVKWHGESHSYKAETVHFPCIVKPASGGSSIGVTIVNDPADYHAAVMNAFAYEKEIIVEDYIKGREFSVAVLDGVALPVIEIAPKEGFYDYRNKYAAGATVETCPADLPDDITTQMQLYAERVVAALGLETYSRMDFILSESGDIYCLEANTLPGMTPTSLIPQEAAAIGIDYEDLCEEIIQISMEKYRA